MLVRDQVKRICCGGGSLHFIGDLDAALVRLNKNQYALMPGFCDVHAHLREPGNSYTIFQ